VDCRNKTIPLLEFRLVDRIVVVRAEPQPLVVVDNIDGAVLDLENTLHDSFRLFPVAVDDNVVVDKSDDHPVGHDWNTNHEDRLVPNHHSLPKRCAGPWS